MAKNWRSQVLVTFTINSTFKLQRPPRMTGRVEVMIKQTDYT